MLSIFYDLETTQLEFCGQILNYAFVTVDENFEVVSEFCGKIKISNTQLPNPYAILANRVDVIEHNLETQDTEIDACLKIRKYLESVITQSKDPVMLIGYNSARFDLHYLRTTLIRNGISPYFGKNIQYGDVLHLVRKLSITSEDFLKTMGFDPNSEERLKLSLENVCHCHNLLDGAQEHESKFDVMLTIELAKTIKKLYGLDIRTYCAYEPKSDIVVKVHTKIHRPDSSEEDTSPYAVMAKLCEEGNYSLWINLLKYKKLPKNPTIDEQKSCISWYNRNGSIFYVDDTQNSFTEKVLETASIAKQELSHINLSNFFPKRNCDIESFIYMMPINELSALYEAIWMKDLTNIKRLKSKFGSELYLRNKMVNSQPNENILNLLENYCIYRYSGKMKTNRYDIDENLPESFHTSLKTLYENCLDLLESGNDSDKKLITNLIKFYENSIVYKLCAKELL